MGKLTSNLSITADQNFNFEISKNFSESLVVNQELDNTDNGVQIIAFNPSQIQAGSLADSKMLVLSNAGTVPAEITIRFPDWTSGTPDSVGTADTTHKCMLKPLEFITLPNIRFLGAGAGLPSLAMGDGGALNNTTPNSAGKVDSGANTNEGGTFTVGDTTLTVTDGDYFEVGDYIRIENEICEVTAISTNDLTVKRGMLGSTDASHSDTDIYFHHFNSYYDYDKVLSGSSQLVQTDAQGQFLSKNFFGYGRTGDDVASGLVAGSVAIKFFESAYQNFGFNKRITNSTSTKLDVSTAYAFDLTVDDSSATTISFTTGSDATFKDVISKIQTAINNEVEDNTSNLYNYPCTISLANGDVRVVSSSHLFPHDGTNGSQVLLESGSTGTDLFAGTSGIFPAEANLPKAVKPQLPADTIMDKATGVSKPNTGAFLIDNGNGNLVSEGGAFGSGSINYQTGEISFISAPLNASFVINGHYDSGFSGEVHSSTTKQNMITYIYGRSVNPKINTVVNVVGFN